MAHELPRVREDTPKARRRIEYLVPDGYGKETWPSTFVFPPRVEDTVESSAGNRLRIAEITHRHNGITLRLARDLGGTSPVAGGGAQEGDW